MSTESKPRFGQILSSRSNQMPPSELEIHLRQHCQCVKVVARPLNGAHLLVLPVSTGEVTIAVRVYYGNELPPHASHIPEEDDTDAALDGLAKFRKSFALSVVFVVLTPEERYDQLQHRTSFVRRAQHILTTPSTFFSSDSTTASKTTVSAKTVKTTTRLWLVPSSAAAIQALIGLGDALLPAKRQLQQEWYTHQQHEAFVPSGALSDDAVSRRASVHVQRALSRWANRNGVPQHEIQLLWQAYGSLETIVHQAAQGFPGVRISESTAWLLHYFFHGTQPEEWEELRRQASPAGAPRPSYYIHPDAHPSRNHPPARRSFPQRDFMY